MKKLTLLFALVCSLQLFAELQNGVIYVKPGATGTGASWADALGDIQTAINLAKSDNPAARKDVWVAAGEYEISTAINLIDSVNVYGSFVGTETAVAERAKMANGKAWEFEHPTTLTGNNCRIVQASKRPFIYATVLDGFILKGGNGNSTVTPGSGGAIMIQPNVVLQNCIIKNSSSAAAGGGVMMNGGGTVRFCLIKDNVHTTGGNGGGGVFCNTSSYGYVGYIENCEITGNSSNIRGAGIGVQGSTNTYVSNCKIYNNTSIDGTVLKPGAGVYSNSAFNRISNCLIYNNTGASAVYYNGGSFFNNTVVKNVGGLYTGSNAINLTNNVVWACATDATGATATSITGAANASSTVQNNATYNPLPTDKSWTLADNILLSSNVSNGDVVDPAPGTVGSGPKFHKVSSFFGATTISEQLLNLDSVNWNINTVSPLVNMGKVVAAVTEDFTGLVRPQGFPIAEAKYDIGAYELPYYLVVAGEGETGNGYVYSSMGEILAKDYTYGYAKGSKLELFFEPKTSYKMERAYYTISTDGGNTFTGNEVDFMQDIDQDGFWSMTVQNSFKVNVVWVSLTALQNLGSTQINCFGTKGGIQIRGIEQKETVKLYNLSGMEVRKQNAITGDVFINVPQGIYIVRIGDKAAKVVVE
ncbi:MAG: right-handed parallel beta-helix repeat-containing protein [Paludibacter sp.]|nr:right-handed parallel beta-helix repeat-containing protein [Paludibacter sp.]